MNRHAHLGPIDGSLEHQKKPNRFLRVCQLPNNPVNRETIMASTLTTYLNFFWAGLRKHGQTGGIVPSQRFLIARMIAPVPETYRGQIIELGAGTGALTLRLAARCPAARILACEINPILARNSRSNLAAAGLTGRVEVRADSAEHLLREIHRGGIERPDYVISGIPLGNLGGDKARSLLDTIRQTLGEDGMYIQFQHSMLDRRKIMATFPNTRTALVLLNVPPAVVYYARGGGEGSSERRLEPACALVRKLPSAAELEPKVAPVTKQNVANRYASVAHCRSACLHALWRKLEPNQSARASSLAYKSGKTCAVNYDVEFRTSGKSPRADPLR